MENTCEEEPQRGLRLDVQPHDFAAPQLAWVAGVIGEGEGECKKVIEENGDSLPLPGYFGTKEIGNE